MVYSLKKSYINRKKAQPKKGSGKKARKKAKKMQIKHTHTKRRKRKNKIEDEMNVTNLPQKRSESQMSGLRRIGGSFAEQKNEEVSPQNKA